MDCIYLAGEPSRAAAAVSSEAPGSLAEASSERDAALEPAVGNSCNASNYSQLPIKHTNLEHTCKEFKYLKFWLAFELFIGLFNSSRS